MQPSTHPIFWRDATLPHVELRQVLDGRQVCYNPHSHEQWSMGAILDGQSEFVCADRLYAVDSGTLVMMNPNVVHACNPQQDSPWAYYMLHIDKSWLAELLYESGVRAHKEWRDTPLDVLKVNPFYDDFIALSQTLMSTEFTPLEKDNKLQKYFINLVSHLDKEQDPTKTPLAPNTLYKIAEHLNQHCLHNTDIEEVSAMFGFSTSYLVRAFKRHFNITPHAYRINRRIQLGQQALKNGEPISSVAQSVGFSDQAHFQRVFKQRVAATPDQYRRSMAESELTLD